MGSVLGIFPVRALSRKQTEIRDQITTQGIAPFPQHLQHIAELVGEANVSIDIMADCVDYGSFFEPKTHRELVDKLVKAHKEGVKVRILVCGPPQPIPTIVFFLKKKSIMMELFMIITLIIKDSVNTMKLYIAIAK